MNRQPASSNAFRFAADNMPASALGDPLTEPDKIINTGSIDVGIEGGLTCHVATCIPVTTSPTYGSELTKPLVR